MGTAPYFDRATVAAAQVIAGFDAGAFTSALDKTSVGISIGEEAASSPQGLACADLLLRLCSRLYPRLTIFAPDPSPVMAPDTAADPADQPQAVRSKLVELARAINPDITIADTATTIAHIGPGTRPGESAPDTDERATALYVGCDDWVGRLSTDRPLPVGPGHLPIGAGIAACLAAGALFRLLLDPTAPRPRDSELAALPEPFPDTGRFALPDRTALVGAGAIGQALLWTLARAPVTGFLHVVEPERVDLSNLQRYVLTDMASVTKLKTEVARDHVAAARGSVDSPDLKVLEHAVPWAEATHAAGPTWDLVAVAVDSADARRQVQASLPHHLVNAWTQTGDLGVSTHDFLTGACCACLYLPTGETRNEDEVVATALGVPERLMDVRALLYDGRAVPDELLETIAERLSINPSAIEAFRGDSIRKLYVTGICGGGLIPLSDDPGVNPIHVPLAHQSALAGVLQAARVLQVSAKEAPQGTQITRIDVRRDPPDYPHQAARKDARGICLCQDELFVAAYKSLWRDRREGRG